MFKDLFTIQPERHNAYGLTRRYIHVSNKGHFETDRSFRLNTKYSYDTR